MKVVRHVEDMDFLEALGETGDCSYIIAHTPDFSKSLHQKEDPARLTPRFASHLNVSSLSFFL